MKSHIILGPPGTGKTTYLLNVVSQHLEYMGPDKIAFLSFTKKATREAAERAASKFNLTNLPYFRTIHSLCYRAIGFNRSQMMTKHNWKDIEDLLKIEFTGNYQYEEFIQQQGATKGDKLVFLDAFARTTQKTLRQSIEYFNADVSLLELEQFSDTLRRYKDDTCITDYTGVLEEYVRAGTPLPVRIGIIDEAQDLTKLQWLAVSKALRYCEHVYIAGDDDQAIYEWSGADINQFLKLKGEKIVLDQSYRVPKKVAELSYNVSKRISKRLTKDWKPREEQGNVIWHNDLDYIDLSSGSWLLLARNNYMLSVLSAFVEYKGFKFVCKGIQSVSHNHINAIRAWEKFKKNKKAVASDLKLILKSMHGYQEIKTKINALHDDQIIKINELDLPYYQLWHDALTKISTEKIAYYLNILRKGEKLTAEPRININTIHGVKGGESDNVVLLTDISRKSYESPQDQENRVLYVGLTRTKNNLHLVQPNTEYFYQL